MSYPDSFIHLYVCITFHTLCINFRSPRKFENQLHRSTAYISRCLFYLQHPIHSCLLNGVVYHWQCLRLYRASPRRAFILTTLIRRLLAVSVLEAVSGFIDQLAADKNVHSNVSVNVI